jgi:hypothetical protein
MQRISKNLRPGLQVATAAPSQTQGSVIAFVIRETTPFSQRRFPEVSLLETREMQTAPPQ